MQKDRLCAGFSLREKRALPELASEAFLYEHEKSGARLAYLANKDDNKVFAISFRTPPYDDTGVAHIMEHSVLCGSRKYPLKEPFVELLKGSLHTFLNAMTFQDKTVYPVASRNHKDFRNLTEVYLDAVFHPNIYDNKYILQQEGWRYELSAKDAPLKYKGIVYNEMKGAFSSPGTVLRKERMKALFPSSPYGFVSGGMPDAIPFLTREDFLDFHRRYYHPANSYIVLYGDMDIEETLAFLDREYLGAFSRIPVGSHIKKERALTNIAEVEACYPVASGEKPQDKTFLDWSVVAGDALDAKRNFAFRLLQSYLLGNPAAPLRQALIDAKVGKEVSGYFSSSMLQPVFSVTVSGARAENKEKFVSVIHNTLQGICSRGIDEELLAASLNRLEFRLREADSGTSPQGLACVYDCLDSWLYGGDPFMYAAYDGLLKALREKPRERYYEKLIEQYFLENPHKAVTVLLPQPGLEDKWQAESGARLSNIKAAFSKEEQSDCLSNTKKLLAWQSQADDPEALRKIPVLERSDIKPQADEISCQLNNEGNLDFLYLARFPNQIAYLQLYFAAEALPEELLPYAYLLKDLLGRLATKKYGHAELAKNINTFTGGLFFDLQSFPHKDDANRYSPKFIVSGKALRRNIGKLCAILGEVLTNSLFDDRERLRDLIEERKAGWDAELFGRGQAVVLARLQSYFSRSGQYDDSGLLEYYRFLNALQRANMAKVAEKLRRTAAALFSGKGLLAACCCAQEDKDAVYAALRQTLALLPEREGGTRPYLFGKDGINEGIIAPAQVQYVAAGGNFAQHGYGYKGSMRVLEHILRYDYFWNNIRAKGGAYGANARFDCNGNTVFHSYRDPNLAETLAVFQATPAYLQSFSPGEREMRKYIIGTVSQLDRPLSPSLQLEKAAEDYFRGITQEIRQKVRDEVINCTAGDIRALAAPVQALLQDGYRCVLGAEGKIKANKNIFGAIMAALPH